MKKLLILGGTGFVGRHVCEKLAGQRWQITVPTRNRGPASPLDTLPRVQRLQADVGDAGTLARLVAGHDAVLNLVAQLHGDAAGFERLHVALPRALAQACASQGVRRLIHVSALGADPDRAEALPSLYLRSKARGEAALRELARTHRLALTVLRPSVIFGYDDRFLNLFAGLQQRLPVLPLAGGAARLQPVWVEDVAQAVVRCLHDPATEGGTYELAGPDVRTLRELVRLAGQWAGINRGLGRPVLDLPPALGRLQARLMELAPGPTLLSRDNLDSLRIDNVAGGKLPGLAALGIAPTPLTAVAPDYLSQLQPAYGLNLQRRYAKRH